jgi:hypothetical protein
MSTALRPLKLEGCLTRDSRASQDVKLLARDITLKKLNEQA